MVVDAWMEPYKAPQHNMEEGKGKDEHKPRRKVSSFKQSTSAQKTREKQQRQTT